MSDSVEITSERDCQLCWAYGEKRVPATVDGKTIWGPWANMCDNCHSEFGVGLGTGKGQRLILVKKD